MSVGVQASPITVRAYRPGDETELVALFARVFGKPISEAHWRWKLKAHRCPVENVWLAEQDGRIVFQYAAIPVRVKARDRVVTGFISVDTMVAPEVQKQSLLTRFAPGIYEHWKAEGIAFVCGSPNERWGSMLRTLGLVRLFDLDWLIRPLAPEKTLARRLRLPFLSRLSLVGAVTNAFFNRGLRDGNLFGVSTREVTSADGAFDRLWGSVSPRYVTSLVRDAAFVTWRFFDSPSCSYRVLLAERDGEPAGYLAFWIKERADVRDAYLVELFCAPDDRATAAALLLRVVAIAREARVEKLLALSVPETFLHEFFHHAGFRKGPGRWNVVLSPFDAGLAMNDLSQPRSWYYAGADTDYA
ncbi:MAG: GNAT family N-acetyltransferase [Thermoanaerobaculia bacterium]